MTLQVDSVLGKPLAELTDEELKARLYQLKQMRISKSQSVVKAKAKEKGKKVKEPSQELMEAALAEAMRRVGK